MTPIEIGLIVCLSCSVLVSLRSLLVCLLYKRNTQLQESDTENGVTRKFTWPRHIFYVFVFTILFILSII